MKTIKLYETQSFKKEHETVITGSRCVDGQEMVTLAESIFFPEGGGQYADTGKIMYTVGDKTFTATVSDGQIMDDEPWYMCDLKIPENIEVRCILDWETRFDRMQQHSGEHIIMGVIHNHYGYSNSGFHLSDTAPVTLVLSGMLTRDEIDAVEREANAMIYQNLAFVDTYPTDEELTDINYRSKIEIEGQVRLITIKDDAYQLDCCACCAPHVKSTGQVGIIKVVSIGKHKGGTALGILSGRRALEYVKQELGYLNSIANHLSTSTAKIGKVVDNYRQEIADLKYKVGELTEGALLQDVNGQKGQNSCCIFTQENLSITSMKNVFNYMTDTFPGYSAIFMGNDEDGYRFSAGSNALDARDLAKALRETFGAKGGGKSDMIQGKINAKKNELERFFSTL